MHKQAWGQQSPLVVKTMETFRTRYPKLFFEATKRVIKYSKTSCIAKEFKQEENGQKVPTFKEYIETLYKKEGP